MSADEMIFFGIITGVIVLTTVLLLVYKTGVRKGKREYYESLIEFRKEEIL